MIITTPRRQAQRDAWRRYRALPLGTDDASVAFRAWFALMCDPAGDDPAPETGLGSSDDEGDTYEEEAAHAG